MSALVVKFPYRFPKRVLQFSDLAKKQLGEAEQDRRINAAFAQIVNNVLDVCTQTLIFGRMYYEIAFTVDPKIAGPPVLDPVCFYVLINYSAQVCVAPGCISYINIMR